MLSNYEKELSTHYAQVRKRLRGEAPKPIMAIPPRPAPEPEPEVLTKETPIIPVIPIVRTLIFSKEGFVTAESAASRAQPVPKRSFNDVLKDVSRETDTPMRTILGKRKHQWIVEIRRLFLWRVSEECPHLSIADISRRAGLDHTTVLHALKRHAEINGLPYPPHRVK